MKNKSINEINEIYDLELDKIIKTIKNKKPKQVLLQFPEGMKPYSQTICDYIENKTKVNCLIWLDSCYGACDIPNVNIDLIIQFGHSSWNFE